MKRGAQRGPSTAHERAGEWRTASATSVAMREKHVMATVPLMWVPATEKARLDAALRTLRPLVPQARQALAREWGHDWEGELFRRLKPRFPVRLEDIRFLLRVVGEEPKLD